MPKTSTVPLAYRLTEAVRLIGVSRSQGYKLMEAGTLRTFKSGRARLVSHQALQEYLEMAEGIHARKGGKPGSSPPKK